MARLDGLDNWVIDFKQSWHTKVQFIKYLLPIRYWFHCHVSPQYGKESIEYEAWKCLIMGTDYPKGKGSGYITWRGDTTWGAFTNYNWRRIWGWGVFQRWFWESVLVAWRDRKGIALYIGRYQ